MQGRVGSSGRQKGGLHLLAGQHVKVPDRCLRKVGCQGWSAGGGEQLRQTHTPTIRLFM